MVFIAFATCPIYFITISQLLIFAGPTLLVTCTNGISKSVFFFIIRRSYSITLISVTFHIKQIRQLISSDFHHFHLFVF